MAIEMEYINLVVPITKIEQHYPGGFDAYLKDHADSVGKVIWYDDELCRSGAMEPTGIAWMFAEWTKYGLEPRIEKQGRRMWNDLCVVDILGGPTLDCDWLTWDSNDYSVYMSGKPKGQVVGRRQMQAKAARVVRGPLFQLPVKRKPADFDFGKVEGMLLGVAIGDALGVTTESLLPAERMRRHGEVRSYLPNRYVQDGRGYPSDDTQLTFWALEQLIADEGIRPDSIANSFASGRQIFGLGTTVREFLAAYKANGEWSRSGPDSAGNGALMRIAPALLPSLCKGGVDLWEDALQLGMITHNSRASNSACVAFVGLLWELLDKKEAPPADWWVERYVELARELEGDSAYRPRGGRFMEYNGPLWRYAKERVEWATAEKLSVLDACNAWHSGAYLLETVPSVLYILSQHAGDPEEAIVRAVNDTKDNDTVAAIVGAAVGALHGKDALPSRWVRDLSGRTTKDDDGKVFELIRKARDVFWDK